MSADDVGALRDLGATEAMLAAIDLHTRGGRDVVIDFEAGTVTIVD